MQAYFEPEQAFPIRMLQPVFEISIAYTKKRCKRSLAPPYLKGID